MSKQDYLLTLLEPEDYLLTLIDLEVLKNVEIES